MQLTKKDRTIKYAVYCAVVALASLMQNISGLLPEIGGARCFLLLPVAIILGIDEDEKTAALIGFFGGLLWDCVAAQHMGFNCIFMMFTCYITSALVSYLFRDTYWVNTISSIIVVALYCILYWLLFVVSRGGDGCIMSLVYFYIPCFIYTSLVSLILCFALRALRDLLNKRAPLE